MDEYAFNAPPLKRRKLDLSPEGIASNPDNGPASPESPPSFAHVVEPLHAYSSLTPSRTPSSSHGEDEEHRVHVWLPRQANDLLGTVLSAADSVLPAVGSVVSTTEIISASLSVSVNPSDTTSTGVSSTPSSGPNISSNGPITNSTSDTAIASNTISSSSSIESSTTATSVTDSSSVSPPISAFPSNQTTSATILEGPSGTTTSSSTNTLNSSTSATLFFFTFPDGVVSSFSRQSGSFTTTLQGGEVLIVPSISASLTSQTTTTSEISVSSDVALSTTTSVATVAVAGTPSTAGQDQGTAASISSATTSTGQTTTSDSSNNTNSSPPPAGAIAGGVVGGAAGLAVVVLIAMLFLRWYRRKSLTRHQALPPGSVDSPEADAPPEESRGPGMAERAGLMPIMAAVPGLFRHHNQSIEGSEPSERGFTRVSGRKLPSAFSEGLSSEGVPGPSSTPMPPPDMPLTSPEPDRSFRETTLYNDHEGLYGSDRGPTRSQSPTSPASNPRLRNSGPDLMTVLPGPQRQPQVHSGGPYRLSPTSSSTPISATATAGVFQRSETPSTLRNSPSLRNSRFTEDM